MSRRQVFDARSWRLGRTSRTNVLIDCSGFVVVGRDNKIFVVPEDESDRCRTSVCNVRCRGSTRRGSDSAEFINFLDDIFFLHKRVRAQPIMSVLNSLASRRHSIFSVVYDRFVLDFERFYRTSTVCDFFAVLCRPCVRVIRPDSKVRAYGRRFIRTRS